MLLPEHVLQGWTTTLPARFEAQDITALYCDHATHEQFHAGFKSDMDLKRLPSGKFDTNRLVCRLAAVAMNLLRLFSKRHCAIAPYPTGVEHSSLKIKPLCLRSRIQEDDSISLRAGCDGSGPQCRVMQALHERAQHLPREEPKSRAHRHV